MFLYGIHWCCVLLHNLLETDNEEVIELFLEYDFFCRMILLLQSPFLNMEDLNEILEAMICILEWLEIEKRKNYLKKFTDMGCGPTFAKLINSPDETIRCNARKICDLCNMWLARRRRQDN